MNNWTPDRPTKPGRYEVYIAPECRDGMARRLPSGYGICIVTHDGHELIARFVDGGIPRRVNAYDGFTRALWRPYVEPPDPFAEPVPKPVERLPSDAELVKSAIRLMRTPRRRYSRTGSQRPLWSRVMMLFGHGSTYSRAICRAHGFDPDEVWMIEESPQ